MGVGTEFVEVDGARIAMLRSADRSGRPPVIFLHGITASINFWPAVLGTQADIYNWCSLSLPGHFPSVVPDGFCREDVTAELFADCVLQAADFCFPGQQPHLVGWSTGGFAALVAASSAPERFASVVSISGFARGGWGDLLGVMQRLSASRAGWKRAVCRWNFRQLARHRWLLNGVLRRFLGRRVRISQDAQPAWDSLFQAATQNDPAVLATLCGGIHRLDVSDRLSRVTAPVLVLGGSRDPVIVPAEASYLTRLIPQAEQVTLEAVGHMFFAEARSECLQIIREWIERHRAQVD
ncbi:MAG: alpha/beta hydrolase [Planctomycetaceae bacterium]|nr:alpha/beta hydrolase [Planctomycetaceae bacterium]